MAKMTDFDRGDILPSYWTDALEEYVSGLVSNLYLTKLNSTTVRVAATASEPAAIGVSGKWRYVVANVDKAHPGGGAGAYDVFVTAEANDIVNTPQPNTDNTNYAWDLAIVASGNNPTIVVGVVDIFRKIGTITWDGSAITDVHQTINRATNAMLEDGSVTTSRLADDSVTAAKIAADAVGSTEIATDAVGSAEIAAGAVGNAELAAAAVDAGKVAGSLKPSGSAVAGDEALRALGTSAATACAGNDARLSDTRTPTAGFAAGMAGNGLSVSSDVLAVNVDGATLEINADTLRVKDLGITAAKIANATITATQIASNAITSAKIAASAVTTAKLADASVTVAKLDDGSVSGIPFQLPAGYLVPESVGPNEIIDGSLTDSQLANPNNAVWRTIFEQEAHLDAGSGSGALFMNTNGHLFNDASGQYSPRQFYLDSADYAVAGKTLKFRVVWTLVMNNNSFTGKSLTLALRKYVPSGTPKLVGNIGSDRVGLDNSGGNSGSSVSDAFSSSAASLGTQEGRPIAAAAANLTGAAWYWPIVTPNAALSGNQMISIGCRVEMSHQ